MTPPLFGSHRTLPKVRRKTNKGYDRHMTLFEPDLADVPVLTVLQALADETRLAIVRDLAADGGERLCGSFAPGLAKATRSHHFKVLREAGLTRTRIEGTGRYVRLRRDELQRHFPGLLDSVIGEKRHLAGLAQVPAHENRRLAGLAQVPAHENGYVPPARAR